MAHQRSGEISSIAATAARLAARATAIGSALLIATVTEANAHPLHTTLSTVSYVAGTGMLNVSVRLFADDFSAAVSGQPTPDSRRVALPTDSAMFRYVNQRLAIVARDERGAMSRIPMQWCGATHDGDVVLVCLRGTARSMRDAHVRNRLMSEVFDDQVNMMHVTVAGRRQTMLFTRRDGVKPLG